MWTGVLLWACSASSSHTSWRLTSTTSAATCSAATALSQASQALASERGSVESELSSPASERGSAESELSRELPPPWHTSTLRTRCHAHPLHAPAPPAAGRVHACDCACAGTSVAQMLSNIRRVSPQVALASVMYGAPSAACACPTPSRTRTIPAPAGGDGGGSGCRAAP